MTAMAAVRRKAVGAAKAVLALPGERFYERMLKSFRPGYFEPRVTTVDLGGVKANFYSLNQLAEKRATRIETKEPDTITWLDRIGPSDVLWDVGANIGVYTIYTALKRGCQVISFEPGPGNYYLLNRNIELNQIDRRVSAYCLALSDRDGFGDLSMPNSLPAAAYSQYGAAEGGRYFRQAAIGRTIDTLAQDLPFPTHLKLDVDGLEINILYGAKHTLDDARLRSVIIERDPSDVAVAVSIMADHGFTFINPDAPGNARVKNCIFER